MKYVVLTNGGYFARLILDGLFSDARHELAGVVVIDGDYYGNTGLATLWKVGRQTAPVYVVYKVFVAALFSVLGRIRKRRPLSVEALVAGRAPVIRSNTVNADPVHEFVAKLQPEVLLSVSCPQKISPKLLNLASVAPINIHSSLLPAYAGLAPYFWVLADGQSETGTTVHFMAEQFDEGHVIVQKRLGIPERCSAFRLFALLSRLGSDAIVECIEQIAAGTSGRKQDLDTGSYRSHPTMGPYIALRKHKHCLVRISDVFAAIKGESPFL